MPEPLWLQGLVLVGVGALAGGFTTAIGAWLVFHPQEPFGLGPFTLHGVIPKNQARLAQAIRDGLAGAELERAARRFITGQRAALLRDERPLLDRLPAGLLAALEQGITDYLPVAVEHVGAALADPAARERLRGALKTVLDRSPELKARLSHAVNEAIVEFLRTPIAERLWALGPDRLDGLEQAAGDYVAAALRASETRAWAVELIHAEDLLRKASESELRTIVRLGYGLGALVGAATWGLVLLL